MRNFVICFVLVFFMVLEVCAHSIYLVRHAEKQTGNNPSLTTQGKNRAKQLAYLLDRVDIGYIYSTQYFRTEETVQPLADAKSLVIKSYDPRHLTQLADELKSLDGDALVVGHSNTTPELVAMLSGQEVAALSEKDYGDVYQITIQAEHRTLQHLQIPPMLEKVELAKESIQDTVNFVPFSDRIHTAGQPSEAALNSIVDQQYDVVINLAPAQTTGSILHEGGLVSKAGALYVNIPVNWKKPTTQDFGIFSQILNNNKTDKTLVHCQLNMRASAFTFLYQVIHEKVVPQQAYEYMKKVWVPNDQWRDFVQATLDENGVDFRLDEQQ